MRHGLKGLIGKTRLVNPLHCSVPYIGVDISWSSVWHSGNLVLDPYPETLSEFHH